MLIFCVSLKQTTDRFHTEERSALHGVQPFDVIPCRHLESLDIMYKTRHLHHRISLAFVVHPLHRYFLPYDQHDCQCFRCSYPEWMTCERKKIISWSPTCSYIFICWLSNLSHLLLSIMSTGSSSIWVTFGNVSSAFNTGNVFDKKSSVRFRINSLEMYSDSFNNYHND